MGTLNGESWGFMVFQLLLIVFSLGIRFKGFDIFLIFHGLYLEVLMRS